MLFYIYITVGFGIHIYIYYNYIKCYKQSFMFTKYVTSLRSALQFLCIYLTKLRLVDYSLKRNSLAV